MPEPRWLAEARKHVGLREIVGRKHNPAILRWWTLIRAPFTDDETPWCAGYVGGVLESIGIKSTRSAMARSYERWGMKLTEPQIGCVVTFWRGSRNSGSGHVGFVVGKDRFGNIMVLGGNQGDAVNIKPFSTSRVTSYRWPHDVSLPNATMPVVASDGRVSTNEA